MPDGSCVDAEGFIWNAVWEGYRVERFAPDGRLDRRSRCRCQKADLLSPSADADLDMLFITTSRLGSSEDLARDRIPAGSSPSGRA